MNVSDSYRENTKDRLANSKIYQQLRKNCDDNTDNGCVKLIALVDDIVDYCYERNKLVVRYMGEFTLHDGEHLFRVLRLMGELIPVYTLEKLSNPELALLIISAFFHDVGMAPSEKDVQAWRGIQHEDMDHDRMLVEYHKFNRFKNGKSIENSKINSLRAQGKEPQAKLIEDYLVSEYIRITHVERAIDILEEDWSDKIFYKENDLSTELALLCKSHGEDASKLLQLDHSMLVGQGVFICLPFIGIILRLADILDFDGSRTPKVLFANLAVKDPVSLTEWNKHRSVQSWMITGSTIAFRIACNHPAIEAAVREFCKIIDYELLSSTGVLNHLNDPTRSPFPEYYKIPLPAKVDTSRVGAKTDIRNRPIYLYRDTKFALNKEQIIDILMGTKLYGQPEVSLRELLQNSIDTCKLRQKMELTWNNTSYVPRIDIRFYKEGDTAYLEVEDNGVGMDIEIIDKYYSKVGTSYYKSSDFLDLKTSFDTSFIPTSRFGIGILSYFMITDSIEVTTKRIYEQQRSSDPLSINIVGQDTIFYIKNGVKRDPGTVTKLELKKSVNWIHMPSNEVIDFIKKTIPFPPFNIYISCFGLDVVHSVKSNADILFDSDTDKDWMKQKDKNRDIRVDFDGSIGINGSCILSILEDNGLPSMNFGSQFKNVAIDGVNYDLNSTWYSEINRFMKEVQAIDWDEFGNTFIKQTPVQYKASISRMALHGVEIPVSMFSQWIGGQYQHARVLWPFSVLAEINIGGVRDINLNSARNEILLDDKWISFEKAILEKIFEKIKNDLGQEYWDAFKVAVNNSIYNQSYHRFREVMNSFC